MVEICTNQPTWESELYEEVAQFFPADAPNLTVTHRFDADTHRNTVLLNGVPIDCTSPQIPIERSTGSHIDKRNAKLAVYAAMVAYTGRRLPWGSLTGIRPTRLVYEAVDNGYTVSEACKMLVTRYGVSERKAALLEQIVAMQAGAVARDDTKVGLYVHIPFCTSRCTYCSFVTEVVERKKAWIDPYVEALVAELESGRRYLDENGYKVDSVYVGGGTPTALDADALYRVLSAARFPVEFTCEAGRPDTITPEKLDAMRSCGVTRVSINPQTLVEKTLAAIGRNHTVAQFFEAYDRAKGYGFTINTDLIAGLDTETIDDFRYTVDAIAELRPENVTVHTLARKNGSVLKEGSAYVEHADIGNMTDYALEKLCACGYRPYYLYRQKRMLGNLENVGYTLPDARCKNNITTMEDCMSVFACGAGAISKRVYRDANRIERLANVRDVKLYLDTFSERLEKKHRFFSVNQ